MLPMWKGHALIYVHQAVDEEGETILSPDKQLLACTCTCEVREWTYEVYHDVEAWRHGDAARPRAGWEKLLERLAQGGVSAVVSYRLEAASMASKSSYDFVAEIQQRNVELLRAA